MTKITETSQAARDDTMWADRTRQASQIVPGASPDEAYRIGTYKARPSGGSTLLGATPPVLRSPRPMTDRPPTTTANYEAARAAAEKGISAIPILPGSKVPAVKWKLFQFELPSEELLREWFLSATRYNIAIVCSGMVLFDCDAPEKADLVLAHCGETPHVVKTPRGGIHLGYRKRKGVQVQNLVQIKGQPIDIRTDGGLELIPNSRTEHGAYEWLGEGLNRIADLPVATVGWTRERPKKRRNVTPAHLEGLGESRSHIRFPEAYCLRIPSVQGQNGSRALVRVVAVLRDAGRSPKQALDFLTQIWSPVKAIPPWSEKEIQHAIDRHYGLK